LAVQWLIEVLCFISSSVVADSFVLRKRQLLVAAKRYASLYDKRYAESKKTKSVSEFLK
jgi:hypothetical protein